LAITATLSTFNATLTSPHQIRAIANTMHSVFDVEGEPAVLCQDNTIYSQPKIYYIRRTDNRAMSVSSIAVAKA
jgi:hypothetical protein